MDGFISTSNESSPDSDDEQIINFINHLGRVRKIPRLQIRKDNFNYWDDDEFYCRFRLSKESVTELLDEINESIKHPTNWNHALTSMEMLLITLRYFATGSFYIVVGDLAGIHKTTVGKVINNVTRAIARLRPRYMKLPENAAERETIQQAFYNIARFPRVIGAIDCTHVKIKSPGGPNAEIFRNRKDFFSINVQTLADSTLRILDIVSRWPGSVHDSTIFNNSRLCGRLENNEMGNGIILGDSGYPNKNYIVTPLRDTNTREENLYNESHIRTRNPVERSYGVWKRRFPILSNGINANLNKVQWIVVATAVLHNIAIKNNEPEPPALNEADEINFNFVNNVPVDALNVLNNNNRTRVGLIHYFGTLLQND